MSKHTPGPWEAHQEAHGLFVSAGSFCIARLGDGYSEGQPENGRLIAAAPELLRELRAMLRAAIDPGPMGSVYELTRAVSGARAAIAKATGEQR